MADELFGTPEKASVEPAEEKNHLVELAKEFQKQLSKGFIDYLYLFTAKLFEDL